MKTLFFILASLIILALSFSVTINFILLNKLSNVPKPIEKPFTNEINFIWNDDYESIPKDDSLIRLEFTKGDTIFIGPYEVK
jgi:hypothetical protein